MDTEESATEDIIYIITGIIVTIVNIIEIVVIVRGNKIHKPFEKLLLSLAAADILVSVSVTILKTVSLATEGRVAWLRGRTFSIILLSSMNFSGCNLIVITIDRFLAVKYPLKHQIYVTGRRMNIAIVIVWVHSSIAALLSLYALLHNAKVDINRVLFIPLSIGCLLYSFLLLIAYASIVHTSCVSRAMTQVTDGRPTHRQIMNSFFSDQYKTERNIFYTSCLVSVTFILCTDPFAIEFLIKSDVGKVSFTSNFLLFLNSFLDPFIYFFKGYLERKAREAAAESIRMRNLQSQQAR